MFSSPKLSRRCGRRNVMPAESILSQCPSIYYSIFGKLFNNSLVTISDVDFT
jgi:hypothetical protein